MNSCSQQYQYTGKKHSNHFTNDDSVPFNTDCSDKYCDFIKNVVNESSEILKSDKKKEIKIKELKIKAEQYTDIYGIGFYSLGSHRKTLSEDQKEKYLHLFKEYFLKSFSNRLAEYTNPEFDVQSKKILNENYTIVTTLLVGTSERPEVKINWRVYTKNPDKPLIRDSIIEGLSLARTQKEEFSSIIISNNNDINALFEKLEEFIEK